MILTISRFNFTPNSILYTKINYYGGLRTTQTANLHLKNLRNSESDRSLHKERYRVLHHSAATIKKNNIAILPRASINVLQYNKLPINLPLTASSNFSTKTSTIPDSNATKTTTSNNISEFYNGANVFVTGGTGFLGKVLLEKLIRACDGIESIYVLIRPKPGVRIEERLKKLLASPAFDKVREITPDYLNKIKAVSGDLGQNNLSLSKAHKNLLVDHVNVVFHTAATIRFNEDLKTSVMSNTFGTKSIADLCREMKHLKSFVHVSTAFCNPEKKNVEEMVYDAAYDPRALINCVETLPSDAIDLITPQIIKHHPNTYTLAKGLAECLVLEYSVDLPTAIVRPSIITGSWKEPLPGWVDSYASTTGIITECSRGTIKSVVGNPQLTTDWVPVDIVANTLIAAAWHTAACRSNTLKVYNCTPGQINRLSWKDVQKFIQRNAIEYPTKYVSCYPGFTYRPQGKIHEIYQALYHYLPAYILDLILYMAGRKPVNVRIYEITSKASQNNEFFTLHEWNFSTSSFKNLMKAVNNAEDGKNFNLDLSKTNGFYWDAYMRTFWLGIRQYILKDDVSNLSRAKVKLNRLYWTPKIIQIIVAGAVLRLLII